MAAKAFHRRTAGRIAAVSLLMAAVAGPASWLVARHHAERAVVDLAEEESHRLVHHHQAFDLAGADATQRATAAARSLTGGLFDIAEIYDADGRLLATSMNTDGKAVARQLPRHVAPTYRTATFDSVTLADGRWVLLLFVPLRKIPRDPASPITGYFEGVRVVPAWQRQQMTFSSLSVAMIAALASLLCGAVIYPVVVSLVATNERQAREVLDSHLSMMGALGRAIARRDSDTGTHNYRVAWIASRIGERIGLRDRAMQALIAGAYLHDIGKIGIPDAVLLKPGPLDAGESSVMHGHVFLGEEIVGETRWLDGAKDVVAAHHERWDGTGYPRGLRAEAIPLLARIFAVADVFDALCSKRPYKEPLPFSTVMEVLQRAAGSHFDPGIVTAFRHLAPVVYRQLDGITEAAARELLECEVRRYFGIDSERPVSGA